LISALSASQKESSDAKSHLDRARDRIEDLQLKLERARHPEQFDEKEREANEKKTKAEQKKTEKAERAAQLKKKEKLSDVLLEHGAKFLAMKTAEKTADKGSAEQKAATLKAARSGGHAGAVGPLKKVVRAAAVAAVKKSRVEAKKQKKSKHEIAKLTKAAAKTAVEKLLQQQDDLVEKAAQKWTKAALKKFPPTVFLAEHDDKPNKFVAPPSIHLSLTGDDNAADQVQQLKESSIRHAASGHDAKEAKETTKSPKPEAAAQVAKAAATAKQAAGKVVPEA